jgi:hypothetical protein
LRVDAQRFAHVRVRCHRVRRGDRLDAGIEFPFARAARRHRPGDTRLEPSDDQAAIAQQLEEIRLVADPQIFFVDQRRCESRELGDPVDDATARCLVETRARVQRLQILLVDEALGGGPRGGRRLAERAAQLAVILRDARERGQE